ncbi:MAG: FoF1 ATP synthase subunit gamma, partial [bacterium]|nr:FoF1 ATP synthase subunit gamma [bacterium]
ASGVEIIAIGTKGASTLSALGAEVALAYPKDDTAADDSSVRGVVDHVYHAFRSLKTDRVLVAYTDYQSAMHLSPRILQLYPFKRPPEVGLIADQSRAFAPERAAARSIEYEYEPNKYDVLDYLARRLAQAELYQALLESNASEHASRMIAMKNASDAASDMVDVLVLEYNKARQAAITREIAEISAGATAVS